MSRAELLLLWQLDRGIGADCARRFEIAPDDAPGDRLGLDAADPGRLAVWLRGSDMGRRSVELLCFDGATDVL
jgi:hypothetical protein